MSLVKYAAALSSLLVPVMALASRPISCTEAVEPQLNAILSVVDGIEKACRKQNEELQARGYPHCGGLCSSRLTETLDAAHMTVNAKVGNPRMPGSEPGDLTFSLEFTFNIPLSPSTTIECVNPLSSPIVLAFTESVLGSPAVQQKSSEVCSR